VNRIPNQKQYAKAEKDMTKVLKDLGIERPKVKAGALLDNLVIAEIGQAIGY